MREGVRREDDGSASYPGDGREGVRLMGERETDNSLPDEKAAGQNVMEGIEKKRYSEAVIEGVWKRAGVFVGDSIVRKTDSLKQGI